MKNKLIKILTILIIGIVSFLGFNQIVKAEEVSWTPGNYINIDSATSSSNTAYYLYESATTGINYHNPSIMKIKDNEYVFCIETAQLRGTDSDVTYIKTEISQNATYSARADKIRYALNQLYTTYGINNTLLNNAFKIENKSTYIKDSKTYPYSTILTSANKESLAAAQLVFWPNAVVITSANNNSSGDTYGNTAAGVTTKYNLLKDQTLSKPASYSIDFDILDKDTVYNETTKKYDATIDFETSSDSYMSIAKPTCMAGTTNGEVTEKGGEFTCKVTLEDLEDTVTLSSVGTKVPEVYVYTNNTYQDFVGLENGTTETKTKLVNFDAKTAILKITKTDKEGNLLKDVVFELYGKDNTKLGTCTTDDKGYCEIKNLIEQTYTLKETKTPEGYIAADDTEITVTKVALDKGEIAVKIINEKVEIEAPEESPKTADKNIFIIAVFGILAGTSAIVLRKKLGFIK